MQKILALYKVVECAVLTTVKYGDTRSIGALLVCTVAGFPVRVQVSDDIPALLERALFNDKVVYMYDDNEILVPLTLDDDIDKQAIDIPNSVFFFLYNRDNPVDGKQLYINDENCLKNSNFNPAKPTRIITHGWINSRNSDACTLVRDAYLQQGDYNVIVIDWSLISFGPYLLTTTRVVQIGQFVATMLNFLLKNGMNSAETVMVGHSLGAHVVGIAARNADSKISYVVGLDPALPGFLLTGPGTRISSGDAEYVEIIHTSGGLLGFLLPIGDVDFYPNGGQASQPGCLLDPAGACSHTRSYSFFAESLNSQIGFYAKACESWAQFVLGLCNDKPTSIMGGQKPLFSARGSYYLETNALSPYAKGPITM